MNRQALIFWKSLCAVALLLLLLHAVGGCEKSSNPCGLEVPAGRIQGRVRTGGLAIDAVIVATRVAEGNLLEAEFATEPGTDGRYTLDVPAGRYIVDLRRNTYVMGYYYSGSVLTSGDALPDTVRVEAASSPIEIDFNLGGLTFHIELSGRLEGERGEIYLYGRGVDPDPYGYGYVDQGGEYIENGQLDIQIAGVLPGDYQVQVILGRRFYACYCPYDGEHFWMPGTRNRSESPWYMIAPDSVTALTCQVGPEPARIEGRITGAWQAMSLLEVPTLSLFSPDSTLIMGQRQINDDGSFGVDIHVPGEAKLLVTHYGLQQWIGGPSFGQATVYDLQPGQTISGIELVQSGLRMRVTAPRPSVGTVGLRFHEPGTLRVLATASIGVGSNAFMGIPNLWPGEYLLEVLHDDRPLESSRWRPQWFDRATNASGARIIAITEPGEIVPLDLTLELGGVINGRVEQVSEPPLNHDIILTSADEYISLGNVFSWSQDTRFAIMGLPDGQFKVGAWPSGQGWEMPDPPPDGTVWYPGTTDWEAAGILEIRDAGVVSDIVIPVP